MKFSEWRIAMALIEYDEYKQKLRDLGPELDKLSAALDIESARQEAQRLEDETAQDGFRVCRDYGCENPPILFAHSW